MEGNIWLLGALAFSGSLYQSFGRKKGGEEPGCFCVGCHGHGIYRHALPLSR